MKTLAWCLESFSAFLPPTDRRPLQSKGIYGICRIPFDSLAQHALPTFIYITPESSVLKVGQGYKFLSEEIRTYIKDK